MPTFMFVSCNQGNKFVIPNISISAEEIQKDFVHNQIQTTKNYNDKLLELKGYVDTFFIDANKMQVVALETAINSKVLCYLSKDDQNEKIFNSLVKGTKVSVKGVCKVRKADIYLSESFIK